MAREVRGVQEHMGLRSPGGGFWKVKHGGWYIANWIALHGVGGGRIEGGQEDEQCESKRQLFQKVKGLRGAKAHVTL
jgi:hypothetical protein